MFICILMFSVIITPNDFWFSGIDVKTLVILLHGKSKCRWTSGSSDNRTTHYSKEILINVGLHLIG